MRSKQTGGRSPLFSYQPCPVDGGMQCGEPTQEDRHPVPGHAVYLPDALVIAHECLATVDEPLMVLQVNQMIVLVSSLEEQWVTLGDGLDLQWTTPDWLA